MDLSAASIALFRSMPGPPGADGLLLGPTYTAAAMRLATAAGISHHDCACSLRGSQSLPRQLRKAEVATHNVGASAVVEEQSRHPCSTTAHHFYTKVCITLNIVCISSILEEQQVTSFDRRPQSQPKTFRWNMAKAPSMPRNRSPRCAARGT